MKRNHRKHRRNRRGGCLGMLLFPFRVIWNILTTLLSFTGRVIAAVLGFILLVIGVAISLTGIGAIIGIPLALVGFMLIMRAIF